MATQADYQAALARAERAEKALAQEHAEVEILQGAADDLHDTLSRVLAQFQEYAEEHGDTAGNGGLAKIAERMERENPWMELHPNLAKYGLAIRSDVENAEAFNGGDGEDDARQQECAVCRKLYAAGDDDGTVCDECVAQQEAENKADLQRERADEETAHMRAEEPLP